MEANTAKAVIAIAVCWAIAVACIVTKSAWPLLALGILLFF
jgi:hypothetical protein